MQDAGCARCVSTVPCTQYCVKVLRAEVQGRQADRQDRPAPGLFRPRWLVMMINVGKCSSAGVVWVCDGHGLPLSTVPRWAGWQARQSWKLAWASLRTVHV